MAEFLFQVGEGKQIKMRILFVNKFFYLRGGAERSFFETKRILEQRGHHIIPFSMADERNEPSPHAQYFVSNVEFNRHHSLSEKVKIIPRVIYFRQAKIRLEKLLQREHIDVAHLHNIAHQISPSILDTLQKFGIPVVQTLHDYKLICPTYRMLAKGRVCESCHGRHYYHAILKRCNKDSLTASLLNAIEMYTHHILGLYRRGVNLFISPSYFLRGKLMEHGMEAVPIFYLPNFIDTSEYTPHYGGQNYCVYFGRLASEKGVATLIRSMDALSEFRLLIVGDGPLRKSLEVLVRKKGFTHVSFMGYLQGEALKKVIQNSLFVVVPSEWYENCPFSILESFALGKPVIGSRIGGIPELITPEKDGLLFKPEDVEDLRVKIRHLFKNPQRSTRMGRNAREKVEKKFGVDAHYQQLLVAYNKVLSCYEPSRYSCVGRRNGKC